MLVQEVTGSLHCQERQGSGCVGTERLAGIGSGMRRCRRSTTRCSSGDSRRLGRWHSSKWSCSLRCRLHDRRRMSRSSTATEVPTRNQGVAEVAMNCLGSVSTARHCCNTSRTTLHCRRNIPHKTINSTRCGDLSVTYQSRNRAGSWMGRPRRSDGCASEDGQDRTDASPVSAGTAGSGSPPRSEAKGAE